MIIIKKSYTLVSIYWQDLTHLPLVPYICVSESVNIGSDNDLSPIRAKPLSKSMLGYCQIHP